MISLNQKFLSYDKYRIQIAVFFVCEKSKARRENKTVINQAISGMHWIIKIENTKECIFCYYQKGKKSRTLYICSECKIHLHPNCFYSYHNNIK
ncbi:unnamed protein product [Blepharisma stoltei]|uniref:Phorbol-ester/DAG-type domain-containing protein n=1 Tax=Blepharisma stoltei TaxID=1481888 RepID=A0AAU9JAU2_9CILI|nr:unnamed protein product [Blepharisma stoltei]